MGFREEGVGVCGGEESDGDGDGEEGGLVVVVRDGIWRDGGGR